MRTADDVLLSLQRHVARALPDPWTVKVDLERGAVPVRPWAMVTTADDEQQERGPSTWSTLPAIVYLYVEEADRRTARQAANDAREAVADLLRDGDAIGRPWLLPLFDYSGRNAVQRVGVSADGGTYRLRLTAPDPERGGTKLAWTPPVPHDADALTLQTALDAVARGATRVTPARPGAPLVVEMRGPLAGSPVTDLAADVTALTGAAEVDVEVLAEGDPRPWRSPRDFARVGAISLGSLPDVSDPKQRTASVSARLTWARAAQVPSLAPTLRRVTWRVAPRE